jgi:hypothetical protein
MSISRANPEPIASAVEVTDTELIVYLDNGHQLRAPLEHFPRLQKAAKQQPSEWRLVGRGIGIHWPLIDEDISVENLLLPKASLRYRRNSRMPAANRKKTVRTARTKP